MLLAHGYRDLVLCALTGVASILAVLGRSFWLGFEDSVLHALQIHSGQNFQFDSFLSPSSITACLSGGISFLSSFFSGDFVGSVEDCFHLMLLPPFEQTTGSVRIVWI